MAGLRILVPTVGSAGDLYPFLHVARGLAGRGHRVTVIGPAVHAALAQGAGVEFVGLGTAEDYEAVLAHPDVWHPRRGFGVLWRALRDWADPLADLLAAESPGEPLGIFAHPFALAPAAIARARRPGTRVVAGWLAPANLRTLEDPLTMGSLAVPRWIPAGWRAALWGLVDRHLVDPVALADINAPRLRHGLAPARHVLEHLETTADASLTLFPPWFAPTPADWRPPSLVEGVFPLFDPHAAALPPALQAFLEAGPPPLVFTPGSGHAQAARWFARALAATTRLGRRAVFLTPRQAQVPAALPAHVAWQPYVPLAALLPRCAALIHHGGIGTTAQALQAGVPQLVLPLAYDQFDNGQRVARLRAGASLASPAAGERRLARAIARLLADPAVPAGCREAARRLAQDGTIDLAALAERALLPR